MTKMTEQQIFARMSGHFLCQHLPDDWADWPETEEDTKEMYPDCVNDDGDVIPDDLPFGNGDYTCLDNFFKVHAWEPLEYWPVNDVYELIDSLTRDVMNLMGVDGTDQLL
mgnify:CR=1 FL=1